MKIAMIKPRGRRLFEDPIFNRFVEDNALVRASGVNIFFCPNLACLNIAGTLPEDCQPSYIDEEVDLPFCVDDGWDLVYVSPVITYQVTRAYEILDLCRERNIPTVLGGVHATVLPEEAAEHADTLLLGEEEAAWPEFFADFRNQCARPRYKATQPLDMSSLPLPRYDIAPVAKYRMIHIQAGRGCPLGCDFCENVILHGRKPRHKTPAQVVAEIEFIRRLSDNLPPLFLFSDANMFVDRNYARELLVAIQPLGIRFSCYSDISVAEDEELLELIAAAGGYEMVIGLESLDGRNLDVISPWKRKQRDHYTEYIARIQAVGIGVSGSFIVGYDGDTAETFAGLQEFILANHLYEVSVSVLTPLPGTDAWRRLRSEGRIHSDSWEDYTTWSLVFEPRGMSGQDLMTELETLYSQVFSREQIMVRAKHFKQLLRQRLER